MLIQKPFNTALQMIIESRQSIKTVAQSDHAESKKEKRGGATGTLKKQSLHQSTHHQHQPSLSSAHPAPPCSCLLRPAAPGSRSGDSL